MSTITRHRFNVPADRVWKEIADFGGMARWSPDLAMSTQIARRGIKPGAVRELTFTKPRAGISTIRERIVACGDHWFRYVLDDGFGPYRVAGSAWRVVAHGDACIVEVESHVDDGPWWAMMLRPLVHWQLRRGLKRAFGGLERRLVQ